MAQDTAMTYRIGLDLGGTKMEILVLGPDGEPVLRRRTQTPRGYAEALTAIAALINECEAEIGTKATIGIGIPGTMSPATGLMRTANTEALNNRPFDRDCAAAGAGIVFGVILGTGAGAGIAVNGRVLEGRNGIAGEWGHNPLPWITETDLPLRPCPCGQLGCIERYVAGPALAYEADGEGARDATQLLSRAAAGDDAARRALHRHAERLARSLAAVTNLLDPDVIVLGGGLSNLPHLYTELPKLMAPFVFSDSFTTRIVQNKHGDSSGVRGAAWLWPG
jgi:fructokinase